MSQRRARIIGQGSDLQLEVWGPDLAACLQTAVTGFAQALARVPDDAGRRTEPIELSEPGPAELLVALLDEAILRLDADGELAVDLDDPQAEGGHLRASLVLVPLGDVAVHGVAPKAATWHGLRLEPVGDGWQGRVMLDL